MSRHVDRFGTIRYYNEQGLLHRDDGPAVIHSDGDYQYWVNGQRHRLDGPAVEYCDIGYQEYWIHGEYYKEKEFRVIVFSLGIEL